MGAEAEEKHVGLRNSMYEDCKSGVKSTESKEKKNWYGTVLEQWTGAKSCRFIYA